MADVMTFTSLRNELADAFERGQSSAIDPITYDEIPRCINRAERRIARDIKVQGLQETATGSFADGVAVVTKPTRWRQTISMNFGNGSGNNVRNILLPRSYEYITTIYPNRTTEGTPRFYADYDVDHWLIGPTPDAAYPFEVLYYAIPALLDDSNSTNWLTEVMPDVLLNAASRELAMFLKNGQRANEFEALYKSGLQGVSAEDGQKAIDRTIVRKGS